MNNTASVVESQEDIAQSVYLILTTIKGSDPLRVDFGSDLYKYLDKPLNESRPLLVYSILKALERWETRIKVTKCVVGYSDIAKVNIAIEAEYSAGSDPVTINLNI